MEGNSSNSQNRCCFKTSLKHKLDSNDDTNLPAKGRKTDTFFKHDSSDQCRLSVALKTTFPFLPDEVLTHIFEFLPLRDRKNVKLVCKRWNSACNVRTLLDQEKIIFNGSAYDEKQLMKVLEGRRSKFLNLEILTATLCDFKSGWELHGHKIDSLKFVDCKVSDAIFQTIIMHCNNLTKLSWCGRVDSFDFTNILELLLSKSVVKNNLTSLSVTIFNDKYISDYTFYALFNLFPRIENFTFKCYKWTPYKDAIPTDLQQYSKTLLTSHAMQKIIDFSNVLQTFGFRLTEPLWKIISFVNFERLKHLDVCIPYGVSDELIFTFFTKHYFLESVVCDIHKREDFSKEFVLLLLSGCPNLRNLNLKFFMSVGFEVDGKLYDKLAASNLRSLCIFSRNISLCKEFSSFTQRINNTLKTLKLPLVCDEEVQLMAIRTFRNLICLKFFCLTEKVITEIVECQTNLKIFSLAKTDLLRPSCEIRPTASVGFCKACVMNFEWPTCSSASSNAVSLVSSLDSIISRLNTVDVCVHCWKYEDYTITRFLSNATSLEELCIASFEFFCGTCSDCCHFCSKLMEVCSNLSNLRRLKIVINSTRMFFTEQISETLFLKCPSLRYLHLKSGRSEKFYYFDIVEKKIVTKYTMTCPFKNGKDDP